MDTLDDLVVESTKGWNEWLEYSSSTDQTEQIKNMTAERVGIRRPCDEFSFQFRLAALSQL